MAFTRSSLGTQNSAGPAASLVVAVASAAIGDIVVVTVAAANSGTSGAAVTTTCADAAGNTYTQRSQVNNTAGVADDGITLTVFASLISATLLNGAITVSFSPSSAQGCAMTIKRYRPAAGETASFIAAGAGATGNSAAPSITASSVTLGDTIVGGIAEEAVTTITGDADTTDGTWNTKYEASVGSGAAAAHALQQDKDVTATGAQTFNPTTIAAHNFAINYIVIRSAGPKNVAASAGSYAVTGQAAALNILPIKLPAVAGSYAVTGTAATLTKSALPSVTAAAGSYAATGIAATLMKATTVVPVAVATYAVTGSAATLTSSVAGASIAANPGSYAVSGVTAALKRSRKVAAAVGSYSIAGTAASLVRGKKVTAAAGSYAITGQAAGFLRSRVVSSGVGAYSISGQSVALQASSTADQTIVRHGGTGGKAKRKKISFRLSDAEIEAIKVAKRPTRRTIWERPSEAEPKEPIAYVDTKFRSELEIALVTSELLSARAALEQELAASRAMDAERQSAAIAALKATNDRILEERRMALADDEEAIIALLLAA